MIGSTLLFYYADEVFDFMQENWNLFNEVSLHFFGSADAIIPEVQSRLANPKYSATKKWASFSRVAGPATDRAAAKALISQHLNDPDEFNRHVARTLLDRFFPPQ